MTNNKTILAWIDEMKALVNPDQVVWIDGSEEQLEELRKEAVESGEMIKLNQEKLPGCYYHRTAPNDVARVEDRTLICSRKEEDAGPTNHWKEPQEAYKMLYDIARGSYKGRTMYVIPYSMGPVGSPLAKIGVEALDLPVPGRQHHHLRKLRLRRQRSARQEVLRSAYRFLSG